LRDVAYVKAQTQAALGDLDQYVMKMRDAYPSGSYDTWTDKQTGHYRIDMFRADGSRDHSLMMTVADGKYSGIQVDYVDRTYDELAGPAEDAIAPAAVPTDPASIKAWLDKGQLEIVGQEQVGGHDTVHLRLKVGTADYAVELWVDTTSFLPYKTVADTTGQVSDNAEVSTFEWLPRTDENLSHFDLTRRPASRRTAPAPGATK
jgi:hypothetical protein